MLLQGSYRHGNGGPESDENEREAHLDAQTERGAAAEAH